MSEHYYTEQPTSEIKEKNFSQCIKGAELSLVSVSGVFSHEDRVDRASRLLIESFSPSGKTVLDMGCGYGAVGLFIKALFKSQTLCLTDINERATDYARINALKNSLDVNVVKGDLFSAVKEITFDDIVTNPPFAAGKQLLTQLIYEAFEHLNTSGALWLVAHHNKGGSTLKEIMKNHFGNVQDMEKSGGIRVYRSVRR